MATPLHRDHGRERPSADDPQWEERVESLLRREVSRLGPKASKRGRDPRRPPDQAEPRAHDTAVDESERGVAIDRLASPRSRERTVRNPPSRPRGRFTRRTLALVGAAIVSTALAVFLLVGWLSDRHAASMAPHLVVGTAAPAAVDSLVPLGISLAHADNMDAVILGGLPAGSNITNGRPLDTNEWHLYAYELADTAIRPAEGFVGSANVTVELRRADRTIDQRTLHLEWTSAAR